MRQLLLLFLFPSLAPAASFGTVKLVQGEAIVGTKALHAGDVLSVGDIVETRRRSMVRILLDGGVAMQLGPSSSVELKIDSHDKAVPLARIFRGELLSSVRKGGDAVKYRVQSKQVSLGVRGTTFFVKGEATRTFLCLCEGKIDVTWPKGHSTITATHHDAPVTIRDDSAEPEKAPMGSEHSDEDLAALQAMLR